MELQSKTERFAEEVDDVEKNIFREKNCKGPFFLFSFDRGEEQRYYSATLKRGKKGNRKTSILEL